MFSPKKYYPALDGLRAYSAIAVLLYHTTVACFWLGWVGVHFFFVLSGFLITGILLQSKESDNYFKVFYARRFLRIFPIYYLVLFTTILVGGVAGKDISSFGYYLFYIQNFKMAWHNWDITTFPRWLNHTWTLAIEEQFYIFFPFLVRFLKEKVLAIVCFMFIFLAVFTRYYLYLKFPDNTINWGNTLSNFDFLTGGALLAIGLRHVEPKFILRLLWALFAGFLIMFLFIDKHPFRHPIYLTDRHGQLFLTGLLVFACITVFTLVTQSNKVIEWVFENKYAVYVGKISYGLYLYHYPFFLLTDYLARHYAGPVADRTWFIGLLLAFKITGSLVIAGLSFRFFEKKIMRLKDRFKYEFEGSN